MTTSKWIERWVSPEIQALSAYHVPSAKGMIKLDAMENPYNWPEDLLALWTERLKTAAINRYPDPQAVQLKALLSDVMSVPKGQAMILGNGSDELIQLLAMLLAAPGRVLMAPGPGFVMYRLIAQFVRMEYVEVALQTDDFSLDLPAFLAAIEQHQPALVFIAYPNNPTGNHFSRDAIEQIIQSAPGLVVIDEAYSPFANDTFMGDLGRYPNLLVMRTLSKLGLAGLRLGYLCGPPEWIEALDKLRLPYNVNVLSQMAAELALEHYHVFEQQAERIKADRQTLVSALRSESSFQVYPSDTNFVLFRVPEGKADKIHESLLESGVLIKNLAKSHPMLRDCLRVTVGTQAENQVFLESLQRAIASVG